MKQRGVAVVNSSDDFFLAFLGAPLKKWPNVRKKKNVTDF